MPGAVSCWSAARAFFDNWEAGTAATSNSWPSSKPRAQTVQALQ